MIIHACIRIPVRSARIVNLIIDDVDRAALACATLRLYCGVLDRIVLRQAVSLQQRLSPFTSRQGVQRYRSLRPARGWLEIR